MLLFGFGVTITPADTLPWVYINETHSFWVLIHHIPAATAFFFLFLDYINVARLAEKRAFLVAVYVPSNPWESVILDERPHRTPVTSAAVWYFFLTFFQVALPTLRTRETQFLLSTLPTQVIAIPAELTIALRRPKNIDVLQLHIQRHDG